MKKLLAVFVALLLMAFVAAGVEAQSGSGGYFDFESSVRIMQDLLVLDDVNIQDTLRVETDLTVGDDLTVTDLFATGKIRSTRGTTQTLTADATITDTWSYLPVTAAGAIGTSGIASTTSVSGDILIVTNVSTNAIIITDTNNTVLSKNITLKQFDTLSLVFDGQRWVQLATTNN
jgi:hypothetical protein